MKLHILLPTWIRGGCDEHAIAIAKAAARDGYSVLVSRYLPAEAALIRGDFEGVGATFLPYSAVPQPSSPAGGTLQTMTTIQVLRQSQADVVLVYMPEPHIGVPLLLAAESLEMPAVALFVSVYRGAPVDSQVRSVGQWLQARQVWATVSGSNRDELVELYGFESEAIGVEHTGTPVNTQWTDLSGSERVEVGAGLKSELELPQDARLLLTVARLTPEKGYDVLLSAAESALRTHQNIHFLWAGAGPHGPALLDVARASRIEDHIHLLGHRHDVPRLLAAADLFLFPSLQEGFPFAVLEAMAHATPIIASDIGPHREMIGHDVQGLLCPTGDEAALAHAICWAIDHGEAMERMAGAAQARCRERFSVERMERGVLDLLHSACKKRSDTHAEPVVPRSGRLRRFFRSHG